MSGRHPQCRVCARDDRASLELALAGGASVRAIAKRHGVAYHQLYRHWAHVDPERKAALAIGPVQRAALAARVSDESSSVIDHLKVARAAIYQMLEGALSAADRVGVAMLTGRLHENLRELGRLTGQLANSPLIQQNTTNIFVSPEFARMQAGLMRALAAHPAARADVIRAFRELESSAASSAPTTAPLIERGRVIESSAAA